MAHYIDGKDCMISEWILLIIAYAFVGLRLYTRLIVQREKLRVSEWILIAAAIDALALIICEYAIPNPSHQTRTKLTNPSSTVTFDLGVMDDWAPSVALSKVSFASNYFYDVGMGLPKMSMLAFYWGIFPANRPTLRKAVYAVTGYVFLVYFIVLWIDTFFCGVPVSVQWSQEEGACSVFYAPEPFYFNFAMNQSSYIFVYALPLFLLPDVKSKDHKSAIYFTFMLGLAPALICMIRFVTLKVGTGQENLVYVLSMLEMTTAIMAVSVPGLKPLLDRRSARKEGGFAVTEEEHGKHDVSP
ncbi:hypothetical protein Q7P36_001589 [Cladosporium allicinum]